MCFVPRTPRARASGASACAGPSPKFPFVCTVYGLKYGAQPSLNANQVCECAASRWVDRGDRLLLPGFSGAGQGPWPSHLGAKRAAHGHSLPFVPATTPACAHLAGTRPSRTTALTSLPAEGKEVPALGAWWLAASSCGCQSEKRSRRGDPSSSLDPRQMPVARTSACLRSRRRVVPSAHVFR